MTLDEIIDELIDVPSNSSTDGESALPHFFNSGKFQCTSQYSSIELLLMFSI